MMSTHPTYAFDEGGKVVAFDGNTVIASGTDFAQVSQEAGQHFTALADERQHQATEKARQAATHITTPNGSKGTILTRTAGLWSDEITVRFENGQIRRYATHVDDGLTYTNDTTGFGKHASTTPVEAFQAELDELYPHSRDGLVTRLGQLDDIRRQASHLASQGVSYSDAQALHKVVLAANAERNEVGEALEHLVTADSEVIGPPKLGYTAVEQVSLGRSDDWLEVVAQEMIAETEAQDFDKLLAEGPTEFVSSLDAGALSHSGAVREMALSHIHSKTAGFLGEAVEDYRNHFVAKVEQARKLELTYRREAAVQEIQKETKVADDAPDEALFM